MLPEMNFFEAGVRTNRRDPSLLVVWLMEYFITLQSVGHGGHRVKYLFNYFNQGKPGSTYFSFEDKNVFRGFSSFHNVLGVPSPSCGLLLRVTVPGESRAPILGRGFPRPVMLKE